MNNEQATNAYVPQVIAQLPKGAFLTTAAGSKINTMTIGWGSIGVTWGKPTFTVLVRHSRFTHEMLGQSGEFTISVPLDDSLKTALALCGSKSGRSIDKLAAAGLQTRPGRQVATPVLSGHQLHYECRIIAKQELPASTLSPAIDKAFYRDSDYHTLYVGEIVACYPAD